MSEWQPIETAPNDKEVLVYDYGITIATKVYSEGYWINNEGEFLSGIPTHWMPLPEPPK